MTENSFESSPNRRSTVDLESLKAFTQGYGPSNVSKLRKEGKLEDAYHEGRNRLGLMPDDIWAKRDMAWVLYEFLKKAAAEDDFSKFVNFLNELVTIGLPNNEQILFDQVAWQIGKIVFHLAKQDPVDNEKISELAKVLPQLYFSKPSDAYSFLFKAFHKALKNTTRYVAFADWWGFQNFQPDDYKKEKLPNGRDVMSIAEQALIAYAKHLLPQQAFTGEVIFNKEKAETFLTYLEPIIVDHPGSTFLPYFKAKLLLALGDQENVLSALLPFAKKKKNDFWVWDVISEAFPSDQELQVACLCRALLCKSPDEFLIGVRQKLANYFVGKQMFAEASVEIAQIVKVREREGWKIPSKLQEWQASSWFAQQDLSKDNIAFYRREAPKAESLLYSDIPEETVIVDFVNSDKKMANFICSESKWGFFKYDLFVQKVNVGDVLKVRFNGNGSEGYYRLFTCRKVEDPAFRSKWMKQCSGAVRIREGNSFGFLDDVFLSPADIGKYKLADGMSIDVDAIKTFNRKKNEWGWKALKINTPLSQA